MTGPPWSALVLVVVAAVAGRAEAPHYGRHDVGGAEALRDGRSQTAAPLHGVSLRDDAARAGIPFRHTSGDPRKRYVLEVNSGGVALFDYDAMDGSTSIS